MSGWSYTKRVENELIRLARLVEARASEGRIREISAAISRWEKGGGDVHPVLNEIRRIANAAPPSWSSEADPGVPVAYGISMELIGRNDLSDGAWKAIEVLIALAEI